VLLTGGVFINWFERRGEATVQRSPLSQLPAVIGNWRQFGGEIRFDEQTESVLRTTEYVMREYERPGGPVINLYVGYYASQRTGATYHSPQNCLPGAGWVMREPQIVEITTPRGRTFEANRFIIDNGETSEVLLYWYQGRGRAEASEYRDKVNTVIDSVLRRRSDGAFVRLMTDVGASEAEAVAATTDLAGQLADNLDAYVPQ
jgi:EpsI family protein